MHRPHAVFALAAALAVAVFVLAFVAAPRACEGGLELYFWAGVAALVVWLVLPFVMASGRSLAARIGWSGAFVALGAAVWVAGLFAADVRFMCRLF